MDDIDDLPPKSLWISKDDCIVAIKGERIVKHSWIEKKAVSTEVRNQGKCSACWAFNAAEASQAAMKIAGKHVSTLSPQDIMNHTGKKGCRGAHAVTALQWIKKFGVCTEKDCPYKGTKALRTPPLSKVRYFIDDWKVVEDDESNMKKAFKKRPLIVTIPGVPCVQQYKTGLMDLSRADNLFEAERALNKNLVAEAHSVLLVERGYIIPKGWPGFKVRFWVIKNQWKGGWGNDGFGDIICNSSLRRLKKRLNMDVNDSDWFYGPLVAIVNKSKNARLPYVDKVKTDLSPRDLKDEVETNPEINLIILLCNESHKEKNPELIEDFRLISAYYEYDANLTIARVDLAKHPTAGDILEVRISRKPVLLYFRSEDGKRRNLGDGKKFPERDDLNFDSMLRWLDTVTGGKLKKDIDLK